MRTISIIGTDWSGPQPEWITQPFSLSFDRMRVADWQNVFYELGDLARVDGIAVGIRGLYDEGAVKGLPKARAAYLLANPQPTLMPFYDTGALPDIAGDPGVAHKFDFANSDHIQWAWDRYVRVFFDHFGDLSLERSKNNKPLILWWSIDNNIGHGFVNQKYCQRLLDSVDRQLINLGFGAADHIVDQIWLKFAPGLHVFGVHSWFNPWVTPPSSFSLYNHNGFKTAVMVPSFYNPDKLGQYIIPPLAGDTLRKGLKSARDSQADILFMESGTNFQEGAELIRDRSGDMSKLNAVREHIRLVKGEDMDAISKEPVLNWVLLDFLIQPSNAIPGRVENGKPIPDPNAVYQGETTDRNTSGLRTVLSLQADGTWETRTIDKIGAWETPKLVDDVKVVLVTEGKAVAVFALIRGL